MSKKCKRCHKELNDDANFCESCGKRQKGSRIGNFLKKIFISNDDFDSLIIFVSLSLLWCFFIFAIIFGFVIISNFFDWLLLGYKGLFNIIGSCLIVIYCIRCCSELFKLGFKAVKKTEEGKESRTLLVNLFSGFMTFFALMLTLLVAMSK